ncbi:MAG: penicillin-binding protein [Oscillospiraceae bacterium]|nr:penicillin-binding protein [Oscillospiraceae bacterium]
MKSIASRTGMALLLAGLLLFGLLTFVIRYFIYSDHWFSHSHSADGLSVQQVNDRNGSVLYAPKTDEPYAADALVRKATVHLLGDRNGYIDPLLLKQFLPQLAGFDKINGTYGMASGTGVVDLTIDSRVESVALQKLNGRKGAVGVYNYKTGEVLCAVTTPTFDPYRPPENFEDDAAWEGVFLHRFFQSTYTPGSIFKLVTTAAALETIPDIQDRTFTCTGSVTVNGEVIHCENGRAHGVQTLQDALANSCNCAFAAIAQEVGAAGLTRKAAQIGVTESMFVDGYWTRAGHFDLAGADSNSVAWAGIGQHRDLVNPCQYLTWIGAIANRGRAAMPHLVRRVVSNGEVRYEAKTELNLQL